MASKQTQATRQYDNYLAIKPLKVSFEVKHERDPNDFNNSEPDGNFWHSLSQLC